MSKETAKGTDQTGTTAGGGNAELKYFHMDPGATTDEMFWQIRNLLNEMEEQCKESGSSAVIDGTSATLNAMCHLAGYWQTVNRMVMMNEKMAENWSRIQQT